MIVVEMFLHVFDINIGPSTTDRQSGPQVAIVSLAVVDVLYVRGKHKWEYIWEKGPIGNFSHHKI